MQPPPRRPAVSHSPYFSRNCKRLKDLHHDDASNPSLGSDKREGQSRLEGNRVMCDSACNRFCQTQRSPFCRMEVGILTKHLQDWLASRAPSPDVRLKTGYTEVPVLTTEVLRRRAQRRRWLCTICWRMRFLMLSDQLPRYASDGLRYRACSRGQNLQH